MTRLDRRWLLVAKASGRASDLAERAGHDTQTGRQANRIADELSARADDLHEQIVDELSWGAVQ